MLNSFPTASQVYVREGNTGILYVTGDNGKQERVIPNYDLDESRDLLLEFQELLDSTSAIHLKDNYIREGYNWYPTAVSHLYWHVFFPNVKYRNFLDQIKDKELVIHFGNKGEFSNLYQLVTQKITRKTIRNRILQFVIMFNNWTVLKRFPFKLLFFRFSQNDFRSKKIRKTLKELGTKYIQVLPRPRIYKVVIGLLKNRPYYYYGNSYTTNQFKFKYDMEELDDDKSALFEKAIELMEFSISGYIKEFKIHKQRLSGSLINAFYGFDDNNGYVFPVLYACHQNSIVTIGHQHGAYVKRHASYIMEGIEKSNYKWFDKVIVWGEYWKEHLLNISNVYHPNMFVIGSNKLKWDYTQENGKISVSKNVLIPYEFATNTYKVGKYITKLIELGYTVFLKVRPDENVEDQLESYCLSDSYRKELKIVEKIDSEFMNIIDIIAGTMTTFIYELLPYNKIVWILNTEYRHLFDLVDDGYAHSVKFEDLEKLDESYFVNTVVESEYFFGSETLEETLNKQVMTYLR